MIIYTFVVVVVFFLAPLPCHLWNGRHCVTQLSFVVISYLQTRHLHNLKDRLCPKLELCFYFLHRGPLLYKAKQNENESVRCLPEGNKYSLTNIHALTRATFSHALPLLGLSGASRKTRCLFGYGEAILLQEYSRPEANSATVSIFWLQEYSGPGGYRSQGTGFLLQEYSRPGALRWAIFCYKNTREPGASSASLSCFCTKNLVFAIGLTRPQWAIFATRSTCTMTNTIDFFKRKKRNYFSF